MFAAKCNANAKGELSTQPLEKLTMYKCLVPPQNRLPNALVEEVGERLNIFTVRETIRHNKKDGGMSILKTFFFQI